LRIQLAVPEEKTGVVVNSKINADLTRSVLIQYSPVYFQYPYPFGENSQRFPSCFSMGIDQIDVPFYKKSESQSLSDLFFWWAEEGVNPRLVGAICAS
jgi:hypothetical protein